MRICSVARSRSKSTSIMPESNRRCTGHPAFANTASIARLSAIVEAVKVALAGSEHGRRRPPPVGRVGQVLRLEAQAGVRVVVSESDLERARERVKAMGEAQEGRVAERSELLSEIESLGVERERLTAVLSALYPASRAAAVDPMNALRAE